MLRKMIETWLGFVKLIKSMTFIELIIMLAIALILLAIALPQFMGNKEQTETIILIESEWQCSISETKTVLMPMLIENRTVMIPQQQKVCTQYIRRQL